MLMTTHSDELENSVIMHLTPEVLDQLATYLARGNADMRTPPPPREEYRGGCYFEALRLRRENGGKGDVYYVVRIEDHERTRWVDHAYYVPDPTRLEELALNHADNGFGMFPKL